MPAPTPVSNGRAQFVGRERIRDEIPRNRPERSGHKASAGDLLQAVHRLARVTGFARVAAGDLMDKMLVAAQTRWSVPFHASLSDAAAQISFA